MCMCVCVCELFSVENRLAMGNIVGSICHLEKIAEYFLHISRVISDV